MTQSIPRLAFLACNRVAARFRENPSFYYRCENVAAYLADQGARVAVCHLKDAPAAERLDAVVFHRPRASPRLRWLLWRYRRAGVACIADVDDLIFDERLVRASPAIRNGRVPLPIQWRIFRQQRRALSWFQHLTVSTQPLAEHARRLFPQARVQVLHNAVFWSWRNDATLAPQALERASRVIAYMPGTRSHDRDFALIAPDLARFLRAHPDTVLRVTGPLNFSLDVPARQLIHADRVPFAQYPALFQGLWVNLAPLEQSPFNDCKSALKAMEAGYMGVPTLCSAIPDMDRFVGAGAVPVAEDGWYDALLRLRDDAHYQQLTTGLRQRVLALASVEAQAAGLLALLDESRRVRP